MSYTKIIAAWMLQVAVVAVTTSSMDEGDQPHVVAVVDDYVDDYNIMCHHCYRSVHGEDCVTMVNRTKIERKVCAEDELFCVVEWEKTQGSLTTFTRGCGQNCKPGCRVSGDHYKLEKCTQCCQGDMCNQESGSAHKLMTSLFHVFFTSLAAAFFL